MPSRRNRIRNREVLGDGGEIRILELLKDKGKRCSAGDCINPRISEVPYCEYHARRKVEEETAQMFRECNRDGRWG
jgi:hypothetical protein